MLACIHLPEGSGAKLLESCAASFSPEAELTSPGTILFDVSRLSRLYGGPEEIAHAVMQHTHALGLQANVAVVPAARLSAATRFCAVTETWAELDDEPKIPNTKPPIATAAIRVTAMMSTVAMIGEMAFLPYLPFRMFIGELSDLSLVYERWELLVWF